MNTKIYKYFLFVIVLLFTIGMVSATDNLNQSEDTVTLEKTTPNFENTITNTETTGDNTPTKELKTDYEKTTPKSDSTPLYVSPDVTEEQEGTSENPTTITDAISKVTNDGTIILLPGTTGVYIPTEEILIGDETTSDETNKITLTADNPNIIIDASQTTSLFKIKPSYTVIFNNISIHNAKDTAIYNEGNLTINGEATYENNTVPNQQRGFIYAGGNVLINGSNTFTNNNNTHYGSIIYAGWGNVTINGSNTFSNNNVQASELITGGLISVRGYLTISGTNKFINNSIGIVNSSWYSLQGGVIYSTSGTCNIIGENIFENNIIGNIGSTTTGGVLYSMSTLNVDGKNVFKNNCLNTSQNGQGVAIYASASNVTINSENLFENNVATGTKSAGGAIYATVTANFNINGSNSFKNNRAFKTGGAIHVVINSRANANIIGENLFEQNQVGSTGSNQGAAIYLTPNSHTTINIINASFINNSAIGPGIIYYTLGSYNSNLTTVISGNNFINNTVTGNAILYPNQNDNSELTITNNTFINNIAKNEYGDTIMVTSNCTKIIENNIFTNTSILLTEINLTSDLEGQEIELNTVIPINYAATITRPKGYDVDLAERLDTQVFINDENVCNATGNQITIQPEDIPKDQDTLNIYVKIDKTLSNTITVNLKKIETRINMEDINTVINTPTTLTATVTTITGENVTDGTVTFTDADENIIAEADVIDGIASTTITFTKATETTITATYTPTKTILNTSTTDAILIVKNKFTTTITIDDVTATAGESTTLTATVKDQNDNPVTQGKVTFKVNGKTIKDANGKVIYAKVVDGVATANYDVPFDLSGKNVNITATYSGSGKYESAKETTTVTIATKELTLTTTVTPATPGQTTTLTATLSDNTINTGKIVFKINGKTVKDANGKVIYAKVTNGTVSVDYTLPESYKAGNYTVTATFIASGYDRLEASETLTVTA